jgi:predicted secreted protein
MQPTSMLAIYFLLWFFSLFLVLPFGVRTNEEAGKTSVPGQAESAPHEFKPWRVIGRTTLVAAVLFALFYANWEFEWITVRSFDGFLNPPASLRN